MTTYTIGEIADRSGFTASALRDPPIACTLDADAMADRLADWQAMLARSRSRTALPDRGLRIEFDAAVAFDEVARLVAAEQRCCGFLSFALTIDAHGVALEVRAPEGAEAMLASVFDPPA